MEWHTVGVEEVLDALDTGTDGLTSAEAARRLEHHGANVLPEAPPPRPLTIFLRQSPARSS